MLVILMVTVDCTVRLTNAAMIWFPFFGVVSLVWFSPCNRWVFMGDQR